MFFCFPLWLCQNAVPKSLISLVSIVIIVGAGSGVERGGDPCGRSSRCKHRHHSRGGGGVERGGTLAVALVIYSLSTVPD